MVSGWLKDLGFPERVEDLSVMDWTFYGVVIGLLVGVYIYWVA